MEPGVVFWAERDELATVVGFGVRTGQLVIHGGMVLNEAVAAQWKAALDAAGFTLVTVFAAYNGEDYADIPTVQRTVGFVRNKLDAARRAMGGEPSDGKECRRTP